MIGDWLEEKIDLQRTFWTKIFHFKLMSLTFEETKQAVDDHLEIKFKNDEYCHFRQFLKSSYDFCYAPGNEKNCDWDQICLNITKNALT